jgi:hypothetical protein
MPTTVQNLPGVGNPEEHRLVSKVPVVNAGDDVETWLADGPRVVQLDGIVCGEDGRPGPTPLAWTLIVEPNKLKPAQISNSLAANPTVTLIQPGTYIAA